MTQISAEAVLFDLDGTLIDSLPAVKRAWSLWAERVGLSPVDVLPRIHGRRSLDSVKLFAPHLEPIAEDAWLRNLESSDTEGVKLLDGAIEILESLADTPWAIVTSGTQDVATARLTATGIPVRPQNVYGDDVAAGKPDPEPFALGASRLGVAAEHCVAFEDTVGGTMSASQAGCTVIGIAHSDSDVEKLMGAGAIAIVRSLRQLSVVKSGQSITFTIQEAFHP